MKTHFLLAILVPALASANSCTWRADRCAAFGVTLEGTIPNLTVSSAAFVEKDGVNASGLFNTAPFCRVLGQVPYPTNNVVNIEVWLPTVTAFNGRFLVVGNGGMAGVVDEASLMLNLNEGYAVAGGDSGHLAAENNKGNGAPGVYLPYLHDRDQTLAWIHNSIAYLTPPAKSVFQRFYGKAPEYSYYKGCSTGGAQGFALAQYHPELFDGIVAGSPGNWYSHLALSFLWGTTSNTSSQFLPQGSLDLITKAVLKECDGLDGVEDGVLENPLACKTFDIDSLQCGNAPTSACLSEEQVEWAKRIYQGPHDARNGDSLYPGFSLGSETQWLLQEGDLARAFTIPILQNLVFDNLSYDDASAFNWGSDVDALDQKAGTLIDEISPDLSALKARGGKLIVTQGWADPYNAALWPIQHREQIEQTLGGPVNDWFQLFMVPGGGHCGSASGYPRVPGNWHTLEPLVQWVESGTRPEELLSSDPADGSNTTHKLCPWPKVAKYIGPVQSSWTSYVCA